MPTNVSKLITRKAAIIMVPSGGGVAAAVGAIVGGRLFLAMREAQAWVKLAIEAVRTAAEPNPWKNATDEEIAGEILKGIEAKEAKR
jgi:hypothetical protein